MENSSTRFDIGYKKNQTVRHDELCKKVHCGCMGGMRFSKDFNVLLLFETENSSRFNNYWQDGVFYYMGTGRGDQSVDYAGNRRLAESPENNTIVFLIKREDGVNCRFCGQVKLAGEPFYKTVQDKSGVPFNAVYFPLQLV